MSSIERDSPVFSGVWAAVLLPLDQDGDIDRDGLIADVETLCRSGVDGLYTSGTAGEFHLIDEAVGLRARQDMHDFFDLAEAD